MTKNEMWKNIRKGEIFKMVLTDKEKEEVRKSASVTPDTLKIKIKSIPKGVNRNSSKFLRDLCTEKAKKNTGFIEVRYTEAAKRACKENGISYSIKYKIVPNAGT